MDGNKVANHWPISKPKANVATGLCRACRSLHAGFYQANIFSLFKIPTGER